MKFGDLKNMFDVTFFSEDLMTKAIRKPITIRIKK